MGLTEEQVFQRVTEEISERGYQFFVHCDYDSIRSRYRTHSVMISNGIPDILGIAPDDSVFAVEVKGDTDIKKGKGQAINYKAGSNASYLAADVDTVRKHENSIQSSGLGVISVSETGVVDWKEPLEIENKTALPEIRSQLLARIRGLESFTKIASLNLAHPANFLAPALFLEYHADYWGSMPRDDFLEQFQRACHLRKGAVSSTVEGASALDIINYGPRVSLTNNGQIGLVVLDNFGIKSLDELKPLIEETAHSDTLRDVAPLIGTWLRDQYRKRPDFEALYRTLQTFDPGESVPLTDLSARLIRDHPNTFLRLFCTESDGSRDRARTLLLEGDEDEIYEDLDTFRGLIRQNLFHNFARQLQHIGVLSSETASTTQKLEEYVPEEYPWVLPSENRQTRF